MDDPYNQMAGEQYVKLLKSDGSEAKWILRRTVQVNRNPLEFMNVRVSTEGKLTLDSVDPEGPSIVLKILAVLGWHIYHIRRR